MTTWIGCALLFSVIAGGIYFYYKAERLDREIDRHHGTAISDGDDEEI